MFLRKRPVARGRWPIPTAAAALAVTLAGCGLGTSSSYWDTEIYPDEPISTLEALVVGEGFEGESMTVDTGRASIVNNAYASGGKVIRLASNGQLSKTSTVSALSGTIQVRARGDQCDGAPRMVVLVDGVEVMSTLVSSSTLQNYSVHRTVSAGAHRVLVRFTNDLRNKRCDRNLVVDFVRFIPIPSADFEAETMTSASGTQWVRDAADASGGKVLLFINNGTATKQVTLPLEVDGLTLRARGDLCAGAPRMELRVDGALVATLDVSATQLTTYGVPAAIGAGSHAISLSYPNNGIGAATCDRNLIVDRVGFTLVTPPECMPTTCAMSNVTCGMIPDGCGGQLDCGTCPPPPSAGTCTAAAFPGLTVADVRADFAANVYPLMTRAVGGCVACHSATTSRTFQVGTTGEETFDAALTAGLFARTGLLSFLGRLTSTDPVARMPLGGAAWPQAEIDHLARIVCKTEALAAPCDANRPGFVGLHRLDNTEYANVIRELTGGTAPALPEEPPKGFFTNNASALGIDTELARQYFEAAQKVLDQAFAQPSLRARIVTCDPAAGALACATQVVGEFGARAFRRPLRSDESTHFVDLYSRVRATFPAGASGSPFDESLKAPLQAMLVAPSFLYRVIEMPSSDPAFVKPLTGYELASRLSFFLWGTLPDATLMGLAASGALTSAGTLTTQVDRMLADPKAAHLVTNFAERWLGVNRLANKSPDPVRYPTFNEALRQAMAAESRLLLADIFQKDSSPFLVLNADYTYLDANLAAHYGLPAPSGTGFTRTSLAGTGRAGLVTHASNLFVNSNPKESSIVHRGLWTLERILCERIGQPPNDVPALPPTGEGLSLNPRESLEQHRSDPFCAGCHRVIDPPGLGLENFDVIGRWRDVYLNGDPVDASGQFFNGPSFSGPSDFLQILSSDARYPTCFSRYLMTYGLGRTLSADDVCQAATIGAGATSATRSSELIKRFVLSPQFLNQNGAN